MKRNAFLATTAALASCSGTPTGSAPPSASGPSSVLSGVTVVNIRDGTLASNMTVAMQNGKITLIAPSGNGNLAGLGTVVASGGFVVPGYNDFHAHPLNWNDPQGALTLMLANGITGFRQMSGSAAMLASRKQGPLTHAPQPELLDMPGDILTVANAATPAAAVAQVDLQQSQGADFIKVVGIDGAPFQAALEECTRLGLRLIGHLSATIDVRQAVDAGMRSIEHLGPRDAMLIGCSTQEAAIRQAIPSSAPPSGGPPPPNFITNQITLPTVFTAPLEFARYQQVINTYSDAIMQDLAGHFVRAGTLTIPTLIRLRTMELTTDPIYASDPNLQYVSSAQIAVWQSLAQQFQQQISPASQATLKQLFALQLQLVRPFKSAGVTMLTGSDLGGEWVIPGFGLHQEFDLLSQAGLSPLEILQMTTLNGAQFLGREATMGTVEVGKDANLVVLSANPLQSVGNLHAISGVVRAGSYFSSDALNSLKHGVQQRLVGYTPPPSSLRPACCSYA